MENQKELKVYDQNEIVKAPQAISDLDPVEMANRAAVRLEQHNRFLQVFYSYLDPTCIDFFNVSGTKKARWNWKACNQAINVFGITVEIVSQDGKPHSTEVFEDEIGKYYIFCHLAKASVMTPSGLPISVTMPGYFSTRDLFFGRAHGQTKSIEEVDVQDVIRASATEARKKAVFALLGLGEPTEDDLKKLGVKVDIINTVEFDTPKTERAKTAGRPPQDTITMPQQRKVYAMLTASKLDKDEFANWCKIELNIKPDAKGKFVYKIKKADAEKVFTYLEKMKKDDATKG